MRQLLRNILVLFVCGLSGLSLRAQIQLDVIPDTTRMLIGDQQKITLTITCDTSITDIKIDLDSITKIEGFEILEERNWVERRTQMSKILSKEITFTAFVPGEYTFPALVYHYRFNDNLRTNRAKSWQLTVLPVVSQSQDIEPIKDILIEKKNFWDYKWYLLGGLALLSLLWWWWRRRKKVKPVADVIPDPIVIIQPEIEALEALTALRASNLWAGEDHKAFQTALSRILRQYLTDGHQIPAMNLTSQEIVRQMKRHSFPKELYDIAHKALNIADLVKFANAQSRTEINLSFIDKVTHLVREAARMNIARHKPQ